MRRAPRAPWPRLAAGPLLPLVSCLLWGCDSAGAGAPSPSPAESALPAAAAPPPVPAATAAPAVPSAAPAVATAEPEPAGSALTEAPSAGTAAKSANPCEVRYEDRVGPDGKVTRTMLPRDKSCSKGEGGRTKSGATLGY